MRGVKPKFEYVVYKGDDVVCAGTSREIKEKLNISETHFRALTSTRTFERDKILKTSMIAIKVPIDEIVGVE